MHVNQCKIIWLIFSPFANSRTTWKMSQKRQTKENGFFQASSKQAWKSRYRQTNSIRADGFDHS